MRTLNPQGVFILIVALLSGWASGLYASETHRYQAAGDYNAEHGGVSLVIMKAGDIVFEDYPNEGGVDKAWVTASGTKSFWGVLAAAMVQDGELELDEPVASTITEWQANKMKSWITVRHLLSMTAGLAGRPPAGGRIDSYEQAVALAVTREPGTRFYYQPAPFQVFGELVQRKVTDRYENAVDYLQARIFDQLDISPSSWGAGPDGNPRIPNGSQWTARDWTTFGEFVRLGGHWNGKQLVDADALAENFEGSSANPAYGLGWWLPRDVPENVVAEFPPDGRAFIDFVRISENFPRDMFMAAGGGRQRLYVFPSLEMVVVRQQLLNRGRQPRAGGVAGQGFRDSDFLSLLLGLSG